jgi:glucan-binding YG repeat protein
MNKNVKKIIALALVFGTFSAIAPANNLNLLVKKAYATDDNTKHKLDSLKLLTSGNSTIRLYSDDDYDSDDKVDSDDVVDDGKYYARTSSKTISIDTDGPSTKYVKVFKGTSSSTRGKSVSDDISLSSGTNTIVVRVYSSKPDTSIRYEDDNDVVSEYTLKVKYTGSDSTTSEDSADSYDEVYLDKLSVDYESISLSKSKVAYTYNVASNVDKVTIKAVPENDDYTVRVNGTKVYEDENYKTTVSLSTGVNEITVKVEDEDNNDERIYTLKITKGNSTNSTNATADSAASNGKINKWVQENGSWKYYDALGNMLKSTWFYDRNYGKTYYLQEDGSLTLLWKNVNGKWYYFGYDGSMKTGWIIDNGKYYYLYSDGSMAANTVISGYRLGYDGAWIVR